MVYKLIKSLELPDVPLNYFQLVLKKPGLLGEATRFLACFDLTSWPVKILINILLPGPPWSILIKQRLKITANLLLSLSPDIAWSATRHWALVRVVVTLRDSEISA